jgi:CPA2 family monovalent cation:H+ antiporter-2
MEHSTSLTSLLIVVTIAFLVPIALQKFNLRIIPVVVAEILAGIIIGKSGFNLVTGDSWLELLSLFGFIYLMFLSGLEIDFTALRDSKKTPEVKLNPVKTAIVIFLGIFTLSLALSFLLMILGFIAEPYLMTLIISTISLGVVIPVLKEKKVIESNLGQIIFMTVIISDFVTIILLAVYLSMRSQNMVNILLLLLFFAIVYLVYLFIRRYAGGSLFNLLRSGTIQIGTRAVFALILLFVVLSETLEVEMVLGAFLAGMIVSLLAPNKQFVRQLDSFGYGFLIPIFFVMLGVKLDLWSLFTDAKMMLLIPVLLITIFISKIVPVLWLSRWFSWREVIGSGVILSATLSLVVAAATVALDLGIIDEPMYGALIFVAVLTCLITPILFNYLFPKMEHQPIRIAIIGANHITLPVSQDLRKEGYNVELYTAEPSAAESKEEKYSRFALSEVPRIDLETLQDYGVFNADVLVFGTADDDLNLRLASHAKSLGVQRIVIRTEDPEKYEQVQREGYIVLSTLYASRTLLKALIEHPSAVKLITQHDDSIQEVVMNNRRYDGLLLRELPFLGDTLIMRIFRGDSFIIPHGTSQIRLGDRLLVSGAVEHIRAMKRELE